MARKEQLNIAEYHLHQDQPQQLQFSVHDLHIYLDEHQANTTRPHIHSFYQIIWFKSGKGKHYVDFKAYEVFDNAIFFIAKNQVHYFDHGKHYEGVLIHFNEEFLTGSGNELNLFLKFSLFNNPYQLPSCCVGASVNKTLDEYLRQIKAELPHVDQFGQKELLKTYLKAFLIQVQRRKYEYEQTNGNTPFMVDEKRLQLLQLSNLIEENYSKNLSVADYAKRMHISTRTLSDLTHMVVNKTPSQLIQERIILEAKRLLLHSHLNINQIGYHLGFEDPSYFVKYFKKHTQTAPSVFRKSVR
ncbi:AraC family transcriptional regulator [Chitinophaga sp. Cy-1792]|uniref:AraC family transcriptional regulator n=1 Tax=Chitinophaga sp. Cy-1792 TaxID=2608339 RepID=UPI00141E8E6F|nr:AraC family transcriptional regulator [Chitinophaga sp. Cy-1792]NIG56692.1 helix-turn-helix domain-containing protein [Chitinophaga sp. Cy-1792]